MGRSRSRDRDKDGNNSRRNRRSSSSSGSSGSSSSSRSSSSRSRSSSKDRDRNRDRSRDRNRDSGRRYSGSGGSHRPPPAPRTNRRSGDRNNRPYSPKSKRPTDHRPGYPGDQSGWYAQPYGPHPPPGPDGHPMPPFQNFYNSEGYPPDYQGQFGADYYAGYDPTYYGAPPEFQAPPPHDYGMPAQGGNWDGNNIVYPDVSVPPPPPPSAVIPPSAPTQGPDMVPPPPATLAPEPYNEAKKEAVEQELVRQNRSLAMQRDEYVKKKASLNRELSRLKDQKRELVKENSKDNERILRENAKLQAEIQQKLKSIDNVIEMFSSIIGDNAATAETKKDSSRSEGKKSEKAEKRKRSASPRSETPKKKSAPSPSEKPLVEPDKGKSSAESGNVNVIHYDPEMYWCSACEEFPRTLNDYLIHLHSAEHRANVAGQKDEKPWLKDVPREMTPPLIKDALNKRVPLRGAQFLVSASVWYCTMCKTWLGDIDMTNKHLKTSLHTENYNGFVGQNPHWEVDWLTERTRAYERSSETKRFKAKSESAGIHQDLSLGNLSDQIIAMLNSRKSDVKDSSSSDSSSDSDSERRARREKKAKKKKSKKKKKEKESKKDKSRSPKREREVEKVVERPPPPPVEEIKPPEPEPPKPVAEPPRFHDMNFTPAFHPDMKYKFNSKGIFEETKMIWENSKMMKPVPVEPPTPVPAPKVPSPAKDSKEKKGSPPSKSKKDKHRDRSHEDDDDRRARRGSRDRDRSYDRRHDYRRYERDRDRRDPRDRDRDRSGRDSFSSKDFYGPKEPPKKGGRGRDRKTPERDKSDKSKRLYLPGKEDDEEPYNETAFEKRTSESAKKKDEKKKTSFVIPKTRLPFIGRMPILKKKVDQKEENQQAGEAKEKKEEAEIVHSGSALELMNEMSVEGEDSRQSAGAGEDNNVDDSSGDEETPVIKPTVMIGKRRNYKNRADDNLMEQDMDIEDELAGKEEAKEHNAELHRDFKEALDLLFPEKKDGKVAEDAKIPEVPKVTTQITTSAPPQPYPVYDMSMYTDPATAAAYSMYYDPSVYVQQYMAMGYDQASAIQAVQAAYGVDPSLYLQQQAVTMTAATAVTPAPLPPETTAAAPPVAETMTVVAAPESTTQPLQQPTEQQPPVDTEVTNPPPEAVGETKASETPIEPPKPKRKNPLSQRMRRHLKKKAEKEELEKSSNGPGEVELDDEVEEEEKEEGVEEVVENFEIDGAVGSENETLTECVEEVSAPENVVDQPEENRIETVEDDSEQTSDSTKKPLKVEEMSELALLGIEEDDITAQSFF